jgi:hypothetical protein
MSAFQPSEFEQIEREEQAAQQRLAQAREQAKMNDGEAPAEHHDLIRRLEDEWQRARERLQQARYGKQD